MVRTLWLKFKTWVSAVLAGVLLKLWNQNTQQTIQLKSINSPCRFQLEFNHPENHSEERNGAQRRTKVSFGRAMLQALELLGLVKKHFSG